jgi:AcrR family transcriptional regulator
MRRSAIRRKPFPATNDLGTLLARLADPELAERRRRQIMDAAVGCFRRRGFHQATMAEICAEAGVSAGALYRYFSSKADIIGAIAEDKRGDRRSGILRAAEQQGFVPALVPGRT